MRFFCLALFVLLLPPASRPGAGAHGPQPELEFGRLSLEDGLSQSTVYCVHQDRAGYLWFGTADGLNRYDGYGFTVYRRRPNDSTSLSDNTISAICEDSLGHLWVGTMAQGLNRLDPRLGRFTRFEAGERGAGLLRDGRIRALATDRFGRVWVGTQGGGLHVIDPQSGSVIVYERSAEDALSLPHNTIRALVPDESGLWIGTDGAGLARLLWKDSSQARARFLNVHALGISDGSMRRIQRLYRDREGRLWVGTVDEGAAEITLQSTGALSIRRFPSRVSDQTTITGDIVQTFCEDGSGAMWIGTWEGLNRLLPDSAAPSGYAIRRFTHDPTNPRSISSNIVHSLLLDRSGVMWVGTRNGGVSRFRTGPGKFTLYKHDPRNHQSIPPGSVRAICSDRLGFWIGTTGGGLARVRESDNRTDRLRHNPRDFRSLSSDDVRTLAFDHEGVLWVGTYGGGLNRVLLDGGRISIRRFETPVPKDDEVFAFLQDREHRYWVGSQNGLVRFSAVDPSGKRPLGVTHFRHDGPEASRISHRIVRMLFEDDHGAVWIGTYGGLNRVDPLVDSVLSFLPDPSKSHSISSKVVVSAWQDHGGSLWFGTFGGGLNHFDYPSGEFTAIGESDGLPNSYVYGILEDRDGFLWLSTNRGITRFDRSRWYPRMQPDSIAMLFKTFDARDGLQSNEFNAGASHLSSRGELYFGGIEGLNRFRPETVRDAGFSPPVTVTGFNIFERPVNLDSALVVSQELVLAHDQNHFSFEVAALDYTNPAKNQYQYKLDGLDQEWIRSGSRRYVAYTNLGAGSYTLRVRGTNSDGVWSSDEAAIPLRIEPPFWQTWWFRLGGILLLGAIAGVILDARRRASRREQEARERFTRQLIESQENERKRIAGELHDSLGQNLLIIKNRALMGIDSGEETGALLKEISGLAGQTINEVRGISYGLRPYQLDRLGLTKAIRAVCRQIQEAARVQVESSVDNIDGLLPKDLEINLYRIVQESLNNAVKHARATRIAVTIKKHDGRLAVEVSDDGTGFLSDQVESHGGGGFGLSGIRERARILGGQASVQSSPGDGTRIAANIPLPESQG